jgi:hypothetical protein
MELDLLMLARHAEVRDGLINMLGGGWDTLTLADGAGTISGSIAIRLIVGEAESGRSHPVRVVIAAQDGDELGHFGGDIELPPDARNASIALQFSDLAIPGPGRYAVRLEVEGAVLGERAFRVL